MSRFVISSQETAGLPKVKAVIGRSFIKGPNLISRPGESPVKEEDDSNKLVGYVHRDGAFVRPEVVYKERRNSSGLSRIVDRLIWCSEDFNYGNSLSQISRETVRWLVWNGVSTGIIPWGNGLPPDFQDLVIADQSLQTSAVIVLARHDTPENLHQRIHEAKAPFVAAYYMTESTRVKTEDIDRLSGYDSVFVPSEFCRTSLLESGLQVPCDVWGHGYDHEVFSYAPHKPGRPFTFLWFGEPSLRKGYDLFLDAFLKLKVPNVRAWVHIPGLYGLQNMQHLSQNDPRIRWDARITPPGQLRRMMEEVDVLVLPSRAEGFGLTALEAMGCGRPVITTRFSGPLDFGGDDSITYWVGVKGMEQVTDGVGMQSVPDSEDLFRLMERCALNPEEVREKGIRAYDHVRSVWTWKRKVLEILPILEKRVDRLSVRMNIGGSREILTERPDSQGLPQAPV